MTTTKNNEHKKLNFSSEREQSQACLNSAEHEKNQGRKVLNVPNLRFPEFQGEWHLCKISNILSIGNGRDYKHLEKGNIPVFGTGGYMTSVNDYLYDGETTFIGRKGTINKPYYYKGKFWTVDTLFYTHSFDGVTPHFVYCLFQTINWLKYNEASGVPSLSKDTIEKIKVHIPKIKEQQKISRLILLLDDRIATQNKIIDKLQSLIKGIVDCTILRKEKNAIVGDVCSISEQIRAEANIDDIITVRLHGNGVCKSSAENLQLGATQYYRRRAGQLIYGKQNFHNGAIGIVPISLDNGITSKDIPSFDIDEMKCNSVYLLAQLQSPQYYKPAEALTTGTGSKRLKEDTFLKMPIVLPNKREQDNIAVLIHRASMNLDYAKRLLELLSIQKQFLLRQMFI